MNKTVLYHYTTGHKLRLIDAHGGLKPSGVPNWAPHERGVLWFSSNERYEMSAIKPIVDPRTGAHKYDMNLIMQVLGIYRFAMHDGCKKQGMNQWPAVAVSAQIRPEERLAMAKSGLRIGANPRDWWGTLQDVALDKLVLERMQGDGSWMAAVLSEELLQVQMKGYSFMSARGSSMPKEAAASLGWG